ncbi:uncharacterized protein LOC134647450 [Cydia amplana]|uniref:uncharacterized protein LOC134647450 n=1 Tax=Cydia amplana TaxID=1869771 RepID=UPI002FE55D74
MDKRRVTVMIITKRLVIMVMSVLLALYTSRLFNDKRALAQPPQVAHDNYWDHVLNNYGIPFLQFCITSFYKLYIKLTVYNALMFSMKYLPSGVYLYKFVSSVYRTSRERLKIKQIELEDLVLEIAMVKTKQMISEAECTELLALQEREAARLRDMRQRVQALLDGDHALRKLLDTFTVERPHPLGHHTSDQDLNLIELLAFNKNGLADRTNESVEDSREEPVSVKSEYSSVSEAEVEKDCRIKIIEVTNVYKVAYLKHYIKQKRIRRCSRHALLKKKMSNIKKMLESWQKALHMVMKDHQYMVRQDRDETSETISTPRPVHSDTDLAVEQYSPDWDHPGPYKNYYREPGITECSDDYPCHEYDEQYYGNCYEETETSVYEEQESRCEALGAPYERPPLPRLLEETSSQLLALQDLTLDHNDSSNDLIAI